PAGKAKAPIRTNAATTALNCMGSSTFAYVETQCSRVPFHAIGKIIEIFRKKMGPARDKQPFAVATLSSFSQPTNSSGTQPINFVSKIPSRGTGGRGNNDPAHAIADVASWPRPFPDRALASNETLVLCDGQRTEQPF